MKFMYLVLFTLLAGCSNCNEKRAAVPVRPKNSGLIAQSYRLIYNKHTWKNINDFTANGTEYHVLSNKIVLVHDSATSTLDLNYYSLLESWSATTKIKVISSDAIAGIGTRSINTYQTFSVYASIDFAIGKLKIFSTNHAFAVDNAIVTEVATSTTNLSIKPGDFVIVSIERKIDTIIALAWNFTTHSTPIKAKYAYTTTSYNVPSPNTATFSVYANKGYFCLDSLCIASQEPKNSNILIVTDSKGMYVADNFNSRWPQQISNLYSPTVLSIGGTDGVNELLAKTNEIITLSPRKVLLAVGRNDLAFKMSFDTLKARYSRAVDKLRSSGIDVYHLNCIYEKTENQVEFSNWITSAYGENVIDTYTPTSKARGILYEDGIHPNQAGNDLIASTIIQSGKLQ